MNLKNILHKICSFYLILMFTIPLFIFHDYYYDITTTKYKAFFYLSIGFLILILLIGSFLWLTQKNKLNYLKKIKGRLSKTDMCVLLFALVCILSTICSEYPAQAWSGNMGRFMGLSSILICVGIYFAVSRLYKLQQSIILVFLISVFFVELLGLLNFLSIDLFGFYEYVSDYQSNLYLSTIGNVNFFAALVCLALPFSSVLFCAAKERLSLIIYFLLINMNFIALFISNSDGAHIAIIVFLIALGIYAMKNYDYFKKYLYVILDYFAMAKILGIILSLYENGHYLHTVSSVLAYHPLIYGIIILICIVYFIIYKQKKIFSLEENMMKIKKIYCYYILVGISLLLLIIILYNLNVINISIPYAENYFRFNEEWGTGRGGIWYTVLKAFGNQSFLHMLVGIGPETVRPMLYDFYQTAEVLVLDNVHNEILEYLVTTGIFGLISYLCIQILLIKDLLKIRYREPFAFALLCVIVCYLIQSVFNISQPFTTPLFFIMLAISQAFIRGEKKEGTV